MTLLNIALRVKMAEKTRTWLYCHSNSALRGQWQKLHLSLPHTCRDTHTHNQTHILKFNVYARKCCKHMGSYVLPIVTFTQVHLNLLDRSFFVKSWRFQLSTLRCLNDHLRDGDKVKHMYWDWIRLDGAAVIYEQDTLKIHGFLLLRCHRAVRTLFITHAGCKERKCEEKLLLSESKEWGRAANW